MGIIVSSCKGKRRSSNKYKSGRNSFQRSPNLRPIDKNHENYAKIDNNCTLNHRTNNEQIFDDKDRIYLNLSNNQPNNQSLTDFRSIEANNFFMSYNQRTTVNPQTSSNQNQSNTNSYNSQASRIDQSKKASGKKENRLNEAKVLETPSSQIHKSRSYSDLHATQINKLHRKIKDADGKSFLKT